MRYTLALLTHGDAPHLDRTLESFAAHVTPEPTTRVCLIDGPGRAPAVEPLGPWLIEQHDRQQGFCASTRDLWSLAVRASVLEGNAHVMWLENDFVFDRQVSVEEMAIVMGVGRYAQVSLMRQPVNRAEVEAGGVLEALDATAELMTLTGPGHDPIEWLEHRAYFTTNPSLLSTVTMLHFPWPGIGSECEGRFGLMLRERGHRFAVIGDGTPWVTHLGERSGRGY